MIHTLEKVMANRIASGLQRKTITTCGRWAEKYRVMGKPFPGPWTFTHHPWSRELHDCTDPIMVGQKAAQMGFTECALNKSFFAIDIEGQSVLYVLPASTPDASDFSAARFDPALEMSPHLQGMFSNVKNVGHKRAGNASLYIRGSRSRSQMKSVPVALIIFDELDEMNQSNVTLAEERTSGQEEKQFFKLSTPTVDNFGINVDFIESSQEHFFFKCPCCGRQTRLLLKECLVVTGDSEHDRKLLDSYYKCKE
ncbi:unnamed protein product, partial [marine sediment metagenome]